MSDKLQFVVTLQSELPICARLVNLALNFGSSSGRHDKLKFVGHLKFEISSVPVLESARVQSAAFTFSTS
jgi:hypothetical protein